MKKANDPRKWEAKQILDYILKLERQCPLPLLETRVLLFTYLHNELSHEHYYAFGIGPGRMRAVCKSLTAAGYLWISANGKYRRRYYSLDNKGFNLIQNALK